MVYVVGLEKEFFFRLIDGNDLVYEKGGLEYIFEFVRCVDIVVICCIFNFIMVSIWFILLYLEFCDL